MLEAGQVLETYRLGLPPEELLQKSITAVRIFDHPLKFLTFEGSVNAGKGSVRIAEAGTYQLLSKNEHCQKLKLDGKILKGKFSLNFIAGDRWEFAQC